MSRLSCVQNCICPDYRAFKIANVQTIVRSKLHMSRLSCVQNCICPDYRAFKIAYVQTIVRSKLHMSRLSCVHFFSRPCNFERTTPPCAFISVWTYRLSVWHLNLGGIWCIKTIKPVLKKLIPAYTGAGSTFEFDPDISVSMRRFYFAT